MTVELSHFAKSLKSHMRRANKLNAAHTLILGDTELESQTANLKNMADGEQKEIRLAMDIDELRSLLTAR